MVPLGVDPTPQLGEAPPGGAGPTVGAPDPDHTSRGRRPIIATLVLLIAMVILGVVVIVHQGGPVASPSYRVTHGTVWLAQQKGQSVMVVTVVIKNVGRATGTPTCVVHTSYLGFGLQPSPIAVKPPIRPGGVRIYINPLPIPSVLISQVKKSDVKVTCRDHRAPGAP